MALRLDYPNDFDRAMAARDGRTDLGGDIMVHGKDVSVGCLAMGDEAAEDLFVLAAHCGISDVRVIIVPSDVRRRAPPTFSFSEVPWLPELYEELRGEVASLPSR